LFWFFVYQGENFYHPYIVGVMKELEEKNLIENEGAHVIIVHGHNSLVGSERDNGFNYASTNLSCLWYVLIIII
jgi:hypothetical protein